MDASLERIMRRIERIAEFTATPGQGSTRTTYTPEFEKALSFIVAECEAMGLKPEVDGFGNLRCRLAGREADAPCVMTGSHVDTVINGGAYDGVLGVVAGLEVLSVLVDHGVTPDVPVELVVFAEEEGVTFDLPLAGSKAMTGRFAVDAMKTRRANTDGRSYYETLVDYGLDPETIPASVLKPGEVGAMLELHIEQCIILEHEQLQVGIVERIAGSYNYIVEVEGVANHAGATPMALRQDALVGAARMIKEIQAEASAEGRDAAVATVGRISCRPNASNVIPSGVEFSVDVRDTDADRLGPRMDEILESIERIAEDRNLRVTARKTGDNAPIALSRSIADILEDCARERGFSYKRMHSGALHDAAVMAEVAETCMVFVPSRDGRSHAPEEFTEPADIECGVQLIVDAVTKLTQRA